MRLKILLIYIAILLPVAASHAGGVFPVDQIYDFGAVGIDYKVYHDFRFVNRDDKPVKLDSVTAACDCTRVWLTDSLVAPNDTGSLSLEFSTKDYYGRTSKALYLHTSSASSPTVKFFYLTTVGQWFMGLKPYPASLFFLPGKETLKLSIQNPAVDEVSVKAVTTHDDFVTVKVLKGVAEKGSALELEISLSPDLPKGTLHTSLRIIIDMPEDFPEPALLTIPVKIARF